MKTLQRFDMNCENPSQDKKKGPDTDMTTFIKGFRRFGNDVVSCFTRGYCYWFSVILSLRFPGGTICYSTMNHYVYRYKGRLYDITGDCTDEWNNGYLTVWEEYKRLENGSGHLKRLIECCILKSSEEGSHNPKII